MHKCAVSIQNKISSAEMNHIKKQKYAKSDKELKLQYITGDSPVAHVSTQNTPIAHRKQKMKRNANLCNNAASQKQ